MICQVSQAVVDAQGLSISDLGRWLAVIGGHKFLFDSREEAVTYRAIYRTYDKYNKVVQ